MGDRKVVVTAVLTLGLVAACTSTQGHLAVSNRQAALTGGIPDVLTQHNDNQRTGNILETTLTPANVATGGFGPRTRRTVDGQIYAQLLYASAVPTMLGTKNLLIAATMNNTVYAFDADDTSLNPSPPFIWSSPTANQPTLISPAPTPPDGVNEFLNGTPTIGIMSTPVIDKAANRIYLVAATTDSAGNRQFQLVTLDLGTGDFKGKQTIGTSASEFDGQWQMNRAGLLLAGGKLFVAFASYRDGNLTNVYHGFIFSYPVAQVGTPGGAPETVYCTTCNTLGRTGGAIWQSGSGLVADENGTNLYFMTGNGMPLSGADSSPKGHENSFVMLPSTSFLSSPGSTYTGAVSWTPPDLPNIEANDLDLGSGGPLLVPNGGPLIGGGKTGVLYVFDRNLASNQCFQAFDNESLTKPLPVTSPARGTRSCPTTYDNPPAGSATWPESRNAPPNIHGNPVYYKAADDGVARVYAWSEKSRLKAWPIVTDEFNKAVLGSPVQQNQIVSPAVVMPGGSLSISGNPAVAHTGIVWATVPEFKPYRCPLYNGICDASPNVVPGRLLAFDAVTLNVLYNDPIRKYSKFTPPTIANGRVYVPTFENEILVFGLRQTVPTFDSLTGATVAVNARPGVMASGPSMDVFIRASDDSLKHKSWTGTSWSPASTYDALGGAILSNPAAVVSHVFARDLSYGVSFQTGPPWATWGASSGGAIYGDPTPVIATSGRVDVVGQAGDGTLAHTFLDSAWHPWLTDATVPALGRAMASGAKPFALSLAAGQFDVFAVAQSQQVLHFHYDGSNWTSETLATGFLVSDPVAVSSAPNRIDVFGLANDYQLAHIWCSPCTIPATWSAWETDPFWGMVVSHGVTPQARPAVVSRGTNQMDVFVQAGDPQVALDARLQHMAYVNGSWLWWENLGGSLTSEPTAVTTTQGIQVLVRALDGTLARTTQPGGVMP